MATRIKWHNKGFKALRTHPAVLGDIQARAGRIAATADAGSEGVHVVDSQSGPNRARAAVITGDYAAVAAEAENNNLGRAIDSGR